MLKIIYILMIIFSLFSIQTKVLRRSILYSCVFSLICSFCYLLYEAPDVAIAEAVIGCTLSTILYLVALKKYKIFRVYYCKSYDNTNNVSTEKIINALKNFSAINELQLDLIQTTNSFFHIMNTNSFDILIEANNEDDEEIILLYGEQSNYHYDNLINYLNENIELNIRYLNIIPKDGVENS